MIAGVIRDGAVADLVVFDPATVRSTATYDQPRSFPIGIEHVIVAGTPVVADGVHTGRDAGPGAAPRRRLSGSGGRGRPVESGAAIPAAGPPRGPGARLGASR